MTQDLTQQIITELNETKPESRPLIRLIIEALGQKETQSLLRQTLEIEAAEGMLTKNKKRRRTPGGVFFYLAHGAVAAKGLSWHAMRRKGEIRPPNPPTGPNEENKSAQAVRFQWADRLKLVDDLEQHRGEAILKLV